MIIKELTGKGCPFLFEFLIDFIELPTATPNSNPSWFGFPITMKESSIFRRIDLLNYFNYQPSLFVIEYNNFICNKNEWNKIKVKKNDRIELITIVGGG